MSYKIIWMPKAEATFNTILIYLEQHWGNTAVLNFFDKVEHLLTIISDQPELFPKINEEEKIRKCVIVKQVSLFYKIKEHQVDLIAFWDNRQNPENIEL